MAVSTEVCACDEMAAQKKTDSATTIFTLRLNPRDVRKSHREIRHVSVVVPTGEFRLLVLYSRTATLLPLQSSTPQWAL
jgi:hypothetical protein